MLQYRKYGNLKESYDEWSHTLVLGPERISISALLWERYAVLMMHANME